jgi:hypothetical protein
MSSFTKDGKSNVLDFVSYKAKREMEEHMEEIRETLMALGLPADHPEFWCDWDEDWE